MCAVSCCWVVAALLKAVLTLVNHHQGHFHQRLCCIHDVSMQLGVTDVNDSDSGVRIELSRVLAAV